jgi:integrase
MLFVTTELRQENAMSGAGKIRGRVDLTARFIEGLKAEAAPYGWRDTRTSLVIRVAQSGWKSGDLSFRIKGQAKLKHLSLGRYGDPGASLKEMRARANTLTEAGRQGVDLIADEAEALAAKARVMTLGALTDLYLARRVIGRLRSAPAVARILRSVIKPLAAMSAADVHRRDLAPLLEAIAARGHQRLAGLSLRLLVTMFRWALSQDLVSNDPTKGLSSYDAGTPRDRILDADEIRLLWPWVDEALPDAVRDSLRIQLLTGCRIGEVTGMTTAEIDLDKGLWTLPGKRSKNKKPRRTPLVGLARTIIEARIADAIDGVLFPSAAGSSLTAVSVGTALLRRRDRLPIAMFKSHDLRRTAASMMFELGIAKDVIGAIVGHSGEDEKSARVLIRHYLKSDLIERKRRALEIWDAHLKAIISGQVPVDNVVPMRA